MIFFEKGFSVESIPDHATSAHWSSNGAYDIEYAVPIDGASAYQGL